MPSVCPCCSRSCLPCRIPRPFRPRMRGNRRKAGSCRGQRAAAGPCIHIAGPFVKSSCNVSGGNVLCPSMREPPRPAEPAERCRLPWRLRRPCGRMSLWRGQGWGKEGPAGCKRAGGTCGARDPVPGKNTIRDRRDRQSRCRRKGHGGPDKGRSLHADVLQGSVRKEAVRHFCHHFQTGGRHGVRGRAGAKACCGQRCGPCIRHRQPVR